MLEFREKFVMFHYISVRQLAILVLMDMKNNFMGSSMGKVWETALKANQQARKHSIILYSGTVKHCASDFVSTFYLYSPHTPPLQSLSKIKFRYV